MGPVPVADAVSERKPDMYDFDWEPSLEELYEDPMLQLILKRDGLRLVDVMEAVDLAVEALAERRAAPQAAAA